MMDEHAREPISPALARYRAIFISDVHLGTRNSQTRQLLAFLRSVEADTVYLVGDIIDGWRLKKSWLVLAPGAQRRCPETAAQGSQRHAADQHPWEPR